MATPELTLFPELSDEEQRAADDWLNEYLRLIIEIYRAHLAKQSSEQSTPVD